MGNVAFNPLSALTRATMVEICQNPRHQADGRPADGGDTRHRRGSWRTPDIRSRSGFAARRTSAPQDLDAAGPRGRQAAGARRHRDRGRGDGRPDRRGRSNAAHHPRRHRPAGTHLRAGGRWPTPPQSRQLSRLCGEGEEDDQPPRKDRLHAGTGHGRPGATDRTHRRRNGCGPTELQPQHPEEHSALYAMVREIARARPRHRDKQKASVSGFDNNATQEASNVICTHPSTSCVVEGSSIFCSTGRYTDDSGDSSDENP